jgi:hypothetical protein
MIIDSGGGLGAFDRLQKANSHWAEDIKSALESPATFATTVQAIREELSATPPPTAESREGV